MNGSEGLVKLYMELRADISCMDILNQCHVSIVDRELPQVDAGPRSGITLWVYSRGPLELRFEYVSWSSKGLPVFLVDVNR